MAPAAVALKSRLSSSGLLKPAIAATGARIELAIMMAEVVEPCAV
jgi:hypothetical protein